VLFRSQWKIHSNDDWLIATIIANMAYRQNCIEQFIEKYGNVTTTKCKRNKIKKLILVNYTDKDIKIYKTIQINSKIKNYRFLKHVCKYTTEKEPEKLLDVINCPKLESFIKLKHNREDIKNMYFYGWEYYCYFTPIWKDRIDRYKGHVDYLNKKVSFLDTLVDDFYDKFGY